MVWTVLFTLLPCVFTLLNACLTSGLRDVWSSRASNHHPYVLGRLLPLKLFAVVLVLSMCKVRCSSFLQWVHAAELAFRRVIAGVGFPLRACSDVSSHIVCICMMLEGRRYTCTQQSLHAGGQQAVGHSSSCMQSCILSHAQGPPWSDTSHWMLAKVSCKVLLHYYCAYSGSVVLRCTLQS